MLNRKCPICGSEHAESLKKITMQIPADYHLPDSYDVVRCEQCGFVYADTAASMSDYDWYYTNCNFYGDDSKDDGIYRYEMVREFLDKYCQKSSRMLDVGAGNGRFELALQKNGYTDMAGMDPSQESVDRMLRHGISAYVGSIYSDVSQEYEHSYDCVFLFEVAEHLLCPGDGMRQIRRLLKDDGYFIVSVPDYSQIAEDVSEIPNHFNLEHINYFSEISLDNLMRRNGMRRVDQIRCGCDLIHCYQCSAEVGTMQTDDVTAEAVRTFFSKKEEKEEYTRQVIADLKERQEEIVVWGTGSYVMSLIAQTPLLDCRLLGFVDNNKLKHGRKMYGYNIYTPEFLQDRQVTVLICSMLNGADIQAQLEAMHTENKIVVL